MFEEWDAIGAGYPGTDPTAMRVFDVLAPVAPLLQERVRLPIYELGHEETPTPAEVWGLAVEIAQAVEAVPHAAGEKR